VYQISDGEARRTSTPNPLLTAEDVAAILGVRPQYVYDLARKALIPTVRLGKYVRFRTTAGEEWIAQQEESRAVGAGDDRPKAPERSRPRAPTRVDKTRMAVRDASGR
jgi:excisionase family DNA binding protein